MGRKVYENEYKNYRLYVTQEVYEYVRDTKQLMEDTDDYMRRILGLEASLTYLRRRFNHDERMKYKLKKKSGRSSKYGFLECKVNQAIDVHIDWKNQEDLDRKIRNMFAAMYRAQTQMLAIFKPERMDHGHFRFHRWK